MTKDETIAVARPKTEAVDVAGCRSLALEAAASDLVWNAVRKKVRRSQEVGSFKIYFETKSAIIRWRIFYI
ncbi:MAG: hypothetical protein IPO22_16100 [Anaerolineales bacterium]|nr:hypothetical protein [Anaerolineales bacterium]